MKICQVWAASILILRKQRTMKTIQLPDLPASKGRNPSKWSLKLTKCWFWCQSQSQVQKYRFSKTTIRIFQRAAARAVKKSKTRWVKNQVLGISKRWLSWPRKRKGLNSTRERGSSKISRNFHLSCWWQTARSTHSKHLASWTQTFVTRAWLTSEGSLCWWKLMGRVRTCFSGTTKTNNWWTTQVRAWVLKLLDNRPLAPPRYNSNLASRIQGSQEGPCCLLIKSNLRMTGVSYLPTTTTLHFLWLLWPSKAFPLPQDSLKCFKSHLSRCHSTVRRIFNHSNNLSLTRASIRVQLEKYKWTILSTRVSEAGRWS